MKILLWMDGFWPRIGGVETLAIRYIEGMQKRGYEFVVLAQKDHSYSKDEEIFQDILIRRFDFNGIIAKKDLSVLRQLHEFLAGIKPDLIHLHASVGGSAFAFHSCRHLFRAPVIQTVHSPYLLENKIHPLVVKIGAAVQHICCTSNWVLNEMLKQVPEWKNKMDQIYCGLPPPLLKPAPMSAHPNILLLGRMSPEKGFSYGIEAFSILKRRGSNAQLKVVGGGPERKLLESLVDERGLGDSVEFKGVVSEEEKFTLYNEAAVVIVPSIVESFGLVILEAMQMGRPVVASHAEGIPEVVEEGKTGLLVPYRNPEALADAIQTLLEDPSRANEMGRAGSVRAQLFTMENFMNEYEKRYANLVLG